MFRRLHDSEQPTVAKTVKDREESLKILEPGETPEKYPPTPTSDSSAISLRSGWSAGPVQPTVSTAKSSCQVAISTRVCTGTRQARRE